MGLAELAGIKTTLAMDPAKRRRALNQAAPPSHNVVILSEQRLPLSACRLFHQEGDESRGVPVLQRPSLLSATTIWLALKPSASRGRGLARNFSTSSRVFGGLTTPRFTSAAAASSSANPNVWYGSSRATGFAVMSDQHCFATTDLIQQRAQPVLGFAYTGAFHMATLAQQR